MKLAQDIILEPVITERSMDGMPNKKYTFKVAKSANKIEIANAIEELFDVIVADVNTSNVRGKTKRMGKYEGTKPSWKKAVVTLGIVPKDSKKKATIEFFDGMF